MFPRKDGGRDTCFGAMKNHPIVGGQVKKQKIMPGSFFFQFSSLKDLIELLLMVQKSGDHQLRLVVYPII